MLSGGKSERSTDYNADYLKKFIFCYTQIEHIFFWDFRRDTTEDFLFFEILTRMFPDWFQHQRLEGDLYEFNNSLSEIYSLSSVPV